MGSSYCVMFFYCQLYYLALVFSFRRTRFNKYLLSLFMLLIYIYIYIYTHLSCPLSVIKIDALLRSGLF
jgi:hypothetical protein